MNPTLKTSVPMPGADPVGFPLAERPATREAKGRRPAREPEVVLTTLLTATEAEAKEAAWGLFVDTYTPLLLHTAYRFGRTYDGAMDRYAYLLEHLHRNDYRRLRAFALAGPGRFTTWLVVVSRRLFQDYHRARYGRSRRSAASCGEARGSGSRMRRNLVELISDEVSITALPDQTVPSPEATTQAVELAEAVRAAVESLEPRDQLLLKLRFEDELAGHEIATIMGFRNHFFVYRRLRTVLQLLGKRLPREHSEAVS